MVKASLSAALMGRTSTVVGGEGMCCCREGMKSPTARASRDATIGRWSESVPCSTILIFRFSVATWWLNRMSSILLECSATRSVQECW